jgi:hypothetical protein
VNAVVRREENRARGDLEPSRVRARRAGKDILDKNRSGRRPVRLPEFLSYDAVIRAEEDESPPTGINPDGSESPGPGEISLRIFVPDAVPSEIQILAVGSVVSVQDIGVRFQIDEFIAVSALNSGRERPSAVPSPSTCCRARKKQKHKTHPHA